MLGFNSEINGISQGNIFAETAIHALLPFISTYHSKLGFPPLLQMRAKQRNKMDVGNGLCCTLFTTHTLELSKVNRPQISH